MTSSTEYMERNRLRTVDLYITSKCNRRCEYCYLPRPFLDSRVFMSYSKFQEVIRWGTLQSVKEVTLLGGEASLHPRLVDMINAAGEAGLTVRIVTNGSLAFQRLVACDLITKRNVARVAVSFDTLDRELQDSLRGRHAHRDATAAIALLARKSIPFDLNVTAVRSTLSGMSEFLSFAENSGCQRVNIHWPSKMGLGAELPTEYFPTADEWRGLIDSIAQYRWRRQEFYVEVERGFLTDDGPRPHCAITDNSNLQVLPDGTAYRCGLLVDRPEMASLRFVSDKLLLTDSVGGEQGIGNAMGQEKCKCCPLFGQGERRACIYDKSVFTYLTST